jgi:hypothetical protein
MIVLDLPKPLSVNRTRRIDWRAKPAIDRWVKSADALVMSRGRLQKRICGPFEAIITLPIGSALDADNTPKMIIDYARRLELIDNDDPKRMRRLTVEFGEAPEGCRLILIEWQPEGRV